MKYQIINGNNIDVLKTFPDNHFDSIVTDPPYGIDFLGKSWDANTGALETYQQCLRVLKPGGHILAFSAARTYHHLAITLEQAGFEIRDQIMWIYSSGFPKSQDVGRSIQRSLGVKETKPQKGYNGFGSENGTAFTQDWDRGPEKNPEVIVTDPEAKQWAGWGTALKPAHEPIALARKPIKTSIKDNVLKYGTGALNIDAARVPMEAGDKFDIRVYKDNQNNEKRDTELADIEYGEYEVKQPNELGRFPSNVLGEIPDYQKYFYCPKVSRRERHIGYDTADIPQIGSTHPDDIKKHPLWDPSIGGDAARLKQKIIDAGQYSGNNHPTVKPIELMKYLIKLVTPANGKVLDPFNGSGSTGCAAVELGYEYVGIELDPKYVEIATKRIEAWNKEESTYKEIFE